MPNPRPKTAPPPQCRVTTKGTRCPYPRLRMPSGSLSPMCYWHRVSRTSMDAQIREADRRLEAAGPPEDRRDRVKPAEWPDGERWCAGCQSFVPLWYCTASRCKPCASRAARASYRFTKYGLTTGDTRAILAEQGDRCAICRKRQTDRALATEHNHKTGAVRGMCCSNCNHKLLGGAFDSPRMLLAALVYLTVPPTTGEWLDPEIYGDEIMRGFLAVVDDISRRRNAERRALEAEHAASRAAKKAERVSSGTGPGPTSSGTATEPEGSEAAAG